MSATSLLNTVHIPSRGLDIARGIHRARAVPSRENDLFVQALWRHDLALCESADQTDYLDQFITMYCPDVDREDVNGLANAFLQRTVQEYCDFFGV